MYFSKFWVISFFSLTFLGHFSAQWLNPTFVEWSDNAACLEKPEIIDGRNVASELANSCIKFKQELHQEIRKIQKRNKRI